jgi:hypothetical protein
MIVGSSISFPILNISSNNSIGHNGTKASTSSSSSSSSGVEPTIVPMNGQDKILFKVKPALEKFLLQNRILEKRLLLVPMHLLLTL